MKEADVYLIFPLHKGTEQFKFDAGKISSNFTCELLAIQKVLNEYINFQETEKAKGLFIFSDFKTALQATEKKRLGTCAECA